jgi:hypothetical protein
MNGTDLLTEFAEEMLRLGWKEADLSARLKNDPAKLRMAARVRKETTLPIKWIAARLQMGTSKSAKPMLYDCMRTDGEHTENAGPYAQLRFQPPADPGSNRRSYPLNLATRGPSN